MISWLEPDARGTAITFYNVMIMDHTGAYVLNENYCNTVMTFSCSIPMTLLNSADGIYQLPLNTLIQAKVSARNGQGDGAYSEANSEGVLI